MGTSPNRITVDNIEQVRVTGGGGGGSGNVNITGVNSATPALGNPLPVELSDGTNAFGTAGNPLSVNVLSGGGGGTQYTDGTTNATPIGTVALGKNPSNVLHALSLDASGNLNVNLNANSFGTLTVTFSAPQHVIVDSGTVTANQGGAPWTVKPDGTVWTLTGTSANVNVTNTVTVSGTVTANQGGAPWTVKPDGTAWTLTGTSANVNVTNTVTISGTVTANQGGAPWSQNLIQVAGVALGATAVVNFGTAPAAVAVPGANVSLFAGTTGLTATGSSLNANVTNTITVSQGSPPWTVRPDGTVWTLTGTSANVNVTNTVTVNQGTPPWTVKPDGTAWALTGTSANVNVTNTVTVNQGGAPWSQNLIQVAGVTLGATAVVNFGTAPAAAAVPAVNASMFAGTTGLTVTGSSLNANVTNTVPVTVASLPLPSNAAQEAGGNLATLVALTTGLESMAEAQREQVALLKSMLLLLSTAYNVHLTEYDTFEDPLFRIQ
jgi:hypothetical protein